MNKQKLEKIVSSENGAISNYLTNREAIANENKKRLAEALEVDLTEVESTLDALIDNDVIEVVRAWCNMDTNDDCYFVNVR